MPRSDNGHEARTGHGLRNTAHGGQNRPGDEESRSYSRPASCRAPRRAPRDPRQTAQRNGYTVISTNVYTTPHKRCYTIIRDAYAHHKSRWNAYRAWHRDRKDEPRGQQDLDEGRRGQQHGPRCPHVSLATLLPYYSSDAPPIPRHSSDRLGH